MAAVASRAPATNSPHMGGNNTTSNMNSSPRTTRNSVQSSDNSKEPSGGIDGKTDLPSIKAPSDSKETTAPSGNAPLAPPPRPNVNGESTEFQGHFSKEPNPFESAFGGGPSDTPGKTQLPGVTSLTSPAPLLPGNTPAWPGSLRSGPLSPAMLPGPTGSNDYFNSDHHFGASFPTPNESSLRTGLTPGGGGSMFPQPSPNSQALYNQLQSGGATPGTLDFHRTAMTARAQTQSNSYGIPNTSQPTANPNIQPDLDSKPYNSSNTTRQPDSQDPFSSHQTNDAANGLFMLAQAGGQRGPQQSYPLSSQQQRNQPQQPQSQTNYPQNSAQEHRASKNSIDSTMSNSTQGGQGEYSDGSADAKPPTRTRGKKTNTTTKAPANGKRKTDEPATKASNKKQRGSVGSVAADEDMDDEEDMDDDMDMGDTRKMTDEEKRKNFLERNRVAALKCRQRKKQWLANLQQKVEIFSSENDALAATVTQLREEIVGLKTLLLAHKDCPVSQAQGLSGMAMQQITGDAHQYANPYGMAMGPGQGQMAQAGMQRR